MARRAQQDTEESRFSLREIVYPHLPDARPCTAVRNLVIQSSLAQLQEEGFYERYLKLIDPKKLEELQLSFAPGWTPIALAHAHYQACDDLGLAQEEIARLGKQIGKRLHETTLVHAARYRVGGEFDLWDATGALYRVWGRTYQGGSAQIVRLGPKEKLVELRGFSLSRHRYYRVAQLYGIGSAYESFGAHLETQTIVSYNPTGDELSFRYTWR